MGILKKVTKEQAYLKAGIFGLAGSGKTYTASMLSLGIVKKLADKRPVAFFDTETGSDYVVDCFKKEGVELMGVKSQAFADLLIAGQEAESACSVLIVDSISHVWRELQETYRKKKQVSKLQFHHWADIKSEWARWTAWFLNSQIHIIVNGRVGNEYETNEDEDGKKEIIKGDTKMKAEGEFGYEPSFLIEMIRTPKEPLDKKGKLKGGFIHNAMFLKDRSGILNGKVMPLSKPSGPYKEGDWKATFEHFAPIFDWLAIGKPHNGVDTTRTSEQLFEKGTDEFKGHVLRRRAEIAQEEIQGSLMAIWPGQDAKSKALKAEALQQLFATRSWTAVASKKLEELEHGAKVMKALEGLVTEEIEIAYLGQLVEKAREVVASAGQSGVAITPLADDQLPESFNQPLTAETVTVN